MLTCVSLSVILSFYTVHAPLTCNERRIDLSLPISPLYCRLLPWINTNKASVLGILLTVIVLGLDRMGSLSFCFVALL